jgi:hypothetical protein
VYKAIGLLYLDDGKDSVAAELVDQVRKTMPSDERVISSLVHAMELLGNGVFALILCADGKKMMPLRFTKKQPRRSPKMRSLSSIGSNRWFPEEILKEQEKYVYPDNYKI